MENWLGSSLIQIQGWMNDLNMLLLCFGEKMPGTQHAENASLFGGEGSAEGAVLEREREHLPSAFKVCLYCQRFFEIHETTCNEHNLG